MIMISSLEIQTHLKTLDFTRNLEKSYVIEFTHPKLSHPIYVKKTNRFPLVIHDAFFSKRTNLLKISGVHADPIQSEYFCSNMRSFNKKLNPYTKPTPKKKPEKFGLDFGFDDKPTLEVFIKAIFLKPTTMVSSEISVSASPTASNQTEKDALIKARIGQGAYRKALLDYWSGCAVTGCKIEELLVSSHIKPWREADNNARQDPFNGLLLSPTLDRAFDNGLISFNDDGLIMLSPQLTKVDLELLHLSPLLRLRWVAPEHLPYLAWHRANLFKA